MGRTAPKLSSILLAVAFALSAFGFTLFVWKSFGGPTPFQPHSYRFHVLFGSEASQLSPNAQVRIAGVPVGRVIAVRRRGDGADALLEMQPRYAPVPRDARAIMRYKTLLGETFVEMTPGSRTAPKLPENGTLPRANVGDVQQVDAVLGSFDAPTRAALKRFLRQTAAALKGRGADLNAALGHLAPTTEDAAGVVGIADAERPALQGLIRDAGTTLRAAARHEADLRGVMTAGNAVFAATAARDRQLTATVDALPGFLGDLRDTMRQLDATAAAATPALAALRPAVPLIAPAIRETRRLAPELRRTFTALAPVVAAAPRGLASLDRVLTEAQPLLRVLYPAGRQLVPVVALLGLYKTEIVAQLAKVGSATEGTLPNADGSVRHVLRVITPVTNESFVTASRRLGTNRHNAYPAPRMLDALQHGPALALDCDNVNNPQDVPVIGTGAPPCVVQPPWAFQGVRRAFPHAEPGGP